jgi:hypothetical protein
MDETGGALDDGFACLWVDLGVGHGWVVLLVEVHTAGPGLISRS